MAGQSGTRQLSPELARHARLLALLGADFTVTEAKELVLELDHSGMGAEFPLDASVAVSRLLDAALLIERGGGKVAFRSGVVREAVERAAPPLLAERVHEASYELASRSNDPAALPALAYHAGRCGRHREAFDAHLQIACAAEERHAYADAEIAYGRALEQKGHGEPPEALYAATHGRGLMRYRIARYYDALEDLRLACNMAAARGDHLAQLDTILNQATVLDWLEEWHQSRQLSEEAHTLATGVPGQLGPLLKRRA